jgi:hypothetical protein
MRKVCKRVTQRVDFRGPPTARAAEMLPLFPPRAERCALIEVESMDNVTPFLPQRASASKIACQCPRLACAVQGGAFQWVQVPGAASKAADLGGGRPLPSIAHSDGRHIRCAAR